MSGWRLGWAAALLSLVAPRPAAADIGDYLGKPIASVRVEAEGREVTDIQIRNLIGTTPGHALSMVAVRETVTHLFSLGKYEDVQVRADAAPTGVRLIYDLVPLHPVTRIAFSGAMTGPGIDEGDLRKSVVDRYGPSPSLAREADLARTVADGLVERGYLHPDVTTRVTKEHDPDRSTLEFVVKPGERTTIKDVEITGDAGMSATALIERLRIKRDTPYERNVLNTRVQEYEDGQRGKGYLEAKLTVTTRFEDTDRIVHLAIAADLGPRVRVEFKGDPLPSDKRASLVPIVEERSASEDLLEDSTNRIEDLLHAQGFRDATAPHTSEESNGELIITFTVTRGLPYRISALTVTGNTFASLAEVDVMLGVRRGQPFSEDRLKTGMTAVEEFYRRKGFTNVKTTASIERTADGSDANQVGVAVKVEIAENTQTLVRSLRIEGNRSVPEDDLRRDLGFQPGTPFFLTQMVVDRDTIQIEYANRGYQNATVTGNPGLSADGSRADVVFTVNEGPQLTVDHLLIVGNVRTSTSTIQRELQIKAGEPIGLAALAESQRRLAALGLFRRIRISQLAHGSETTRDVLVSVEEAKASSIGYGGGIEEASRSESSGGTAVERLEIAPRGFFEIGRRNFFGKNRSINLFTRVSLKSRPTSDSNKVGFSEYRVLGTFREPRVFGTSADAYLTGTIEQQIRSNFNFARRAFSAEVARQLTQAFSVSGNYQIQRTELFDESFDQADTLLIARLFPQLLLSSFSTSVVHSTRDDVDPKSGHYFSANGQVAANAIGSEVALLKTYLTAQEFRTIPFRKTVFATSARLGMAYGFPRTVVETDIEGQPILGPDGQPVSEVVRDLPASERFFAGGDTTVRGFALDQLGTPATLDKSGFALGGNALVIFNAELRVPVHGNFGIVGFLDTGNVFAETSDIDLGQFRSSVGFGVRYKSPLGPLRVDIGFKIHRHDVTPGRLEPATALHISLGQAF